MPPYPGQSELRRRRGKKRRRKKAPCVPFKPRAKRNTEKEEENETKTKGETRKREGVGGRAEKQFATALSARCAPCNMK